ncbi:BQ2448_7145 [Microbotryum intermedium]|uniref:BQ2448_7145 protein n=1 Tax=Microbotryum intermedium TaxID=269621 RepID=A0A238FHC5_9BASI|nr:BQ2448_7145 [Microbotryum intermedium]
MANPTPPVFGDASSSRTREPSSPKLSADSPFSTVQLALLRALFTKLAAAPSAPVPPSATAPPDNAPEPTHNTAPVTSTMAMVAKTTFPKHACLDGSKLFANWVHQLWLCLPTHLRSYVFDGVVPATWTPAQLASRNDTACDILVSSIDSTKVLAVLDSIPIANLTAPNIFSALKSCFAPDDATRMLELLSKLWSFRPMPGMVADFDNWASELNAIVEEIIDAKTTLNNVMVTHVLAIVHPSLDSFKSAFMDKQRSHRQLPPMDLILDRVCVQLQTTNLTDDQSAMLASASTASSRLKCLACKGPHQLSACKSRTQHPPPKPCCRCKQKGHWAMDCKSNSDDPADSEETPTSQHHIGYLAASLLARSIFGSNVCIVDSEAMAHMVPDQSVFTTYHCTAPTRIGGIAGGLSAIGIGKVAFVAASGQPVTLTGVLHTPGLNVNLLSVLRLCDTDDVCIAFTSASLDIEKDSTVLAQGTRINDGLYKEQRSEQTEMPSRKRIGNVRERERAALVMASGGLARSKSKGQRSERKARACLSSHPPISACLS